MDAENKPIVINDLLTFLSCKIKDVPREKLLKSIRDYYKDGVIIEAQKSLLENLPTKKSTRHGRRVKNPDTLIAIYDCFQLIPKDDLPTFVCKNLNNVPFIESELTPIIIKQELIDDFDDDLESEINNGEETLTKTIKKEQEEMKMKITDIASVVRQIKDQMNHIVTTQEHPKFFRRSSKKHKNIVSSVAKMEPLETTIESDNSGAISGTKVSLSNPTKNGLAFLQKLIDENRNDRDDINDSDEMDEEEQDTEDEFVLDRDEEMSLCEVVLKEENSLPLLHASTKRNTKAILSKSQQRFRKESSSTQRVIYIKNEGNELELHTDEHLTQGEMDENSIEITDADAMNCFDDEITDRIDPKKPVIVVSQFATDDPEKSDILYFTCACCNLSSRDKSAFNGHICFSKTIRKPRRSRYGLHCSICEYNTNDSNVIEFNEHMLEHYDLKSDDYYECILCVFKGTDIEEYKSHLLTHNWKRPYRCEACAYKCTKELRFRNHFIRHLEHKGPNHYECLICGKVCGTRNTMEKHKQMHKRNFDFKCDKCQITFPHRSALSQHDHLSHNKERTFVCTVCNCLYDSQHSLNIHKRVHYKEPFFTCHVCDAKIKSKTSFRNHVMKAHPDVKAFSCDLCEERFFFKHTLLVHKKTHDGQTYGCPYCKKKFKCASYLKIHCAIHENKKPFKCSHCHFDARSRTELKKHCASEHPELQYANCSKCHFGSSNILEMQNHKCITDCITKEEEDPIEQVLVVMEEDEDEFIYYEVHADGSLHINEIPLYEPDRNICSKKVKISRPKYWCGLCGSIEENADCLIKHLSHHENGVALKCSRENCSFVTESRKTMESHLKEFHNDLFGVQGKKQRTIKSYKCALCDFVSKIERKMIIHVNCHFDKKSEDCFECPFCRKQYQTYGALKNHAPVHYGERPFKCDLCDEKFVFSRYLSAHQRDVHNENSNAISCSHCGCKYKSKFSLARHEKIHTGKKPFACTTCQFRSSRSDIVKIHMLTNHTTSTPFKCPLCDQSFKLKRFLNKHVISHSKIVNKPYRCQECSKNFKNKASFKIHCKNFGHQFTESENLIPVSSSVPTLQIERINCSTLNK